MKGVTEYETEGGSDPEGLKFVFVSKGKKEIHKAIVYSLFNRSDRYDIYNLGFGTVKENGGIDDQDNSNNGDMYPVFYTVINTVPLFFEKYPNSLLYITGSDKKRNRVYSIFLERNFNLLTESYNILGKSGYNDRFKTVIKGKKYNYYIIQKK